VNDLNHRFPRYSKLLGLYPAAYRHEYGEQMLQTLADMLDDPQQSRRAVWARTLRDFPGSLLRQQLAYTATAMTSTPPYLTRTARAGAGLVAPFFLLVLANALSGQALRHSVIWRPNVLPLWLVVLPALAVGLNLFVWLRWLRQQRRESAGSSWQHIADIRRSWPALAVMLVGLAIIAFVYGHDSVHCLTGNPLRELHNPHQTMQCIERG